MIHPARANISRTTPRMTPSNTDRASVTTMAQSIGVMRLGRDDVGADAERLEPGAHPLGLFARRIRSDPHAVAHPLGRLHAFGVWGQTRLLQPLRQFPGGGFARCR